MKNKKSVWSTIILVVAILMALSVVISLVSLIVQIPVAREQAMETLLNQGVSESVAEAAVETAISSLVAGYIIGLTFNAFEAIGGFLFSLKGKWGMFCIVISILGVLVSGYNLYSYIGNKAGAGTIVLAVVSLLLSLLYCVACFMHRKENQEA